MTELTFEEFCDLPWMYVTGITTDAAAHRMYRNLVYGLQAEIGEPNSARAIVHEMRND